MKHQQQVSLSSEALLSCRCSKRTIDPQHIDPQHTKHSALTGTLADLRIDMHIRNLLSKRHIRTTLCAQHFFEVAFGTDSFHFSSFSYNLFSGTHPRGFIPPLERANDCRLVGIVEIDERSGCWVESQASMTLLHLISAAIIRLEWHVGDCRITVYQKRAEPKHFLNAIRYLTSKGRCIHRFIVQLTKGYFANTFIVSPPLVLHQEDSLAGLLLALICPFAGLFWCEVWQAKNSSPHQGHFQRSKPLYKTLFLCCSNQTPSCRP